LRQRVAGGGHAFETGDAAVPFEWRAERIECGQRGVDDFGADAVSGNQRGGNA